MKVDRENNKVYLNDIEKIEFEVFKGFYELIKAAIVGFSIGIILEIIKLIISR